MEEARQYRVSHLGRTIGHYSDRVFLWTLGIGAALPVFLGKGSEFQDTFSWFTIAALVVCMVCDGKYHRGRIGEAAPLCPQCMAEFPLDPNGEAQRYLKQLHFTHRIMPSSVGDYGFFVKLLVILLLMTAPNLVAVFLFDFPSRVNALIYALTFSFPLGYGLWSVRKHAKLQPWCPYCRRRGRDDDEEIIVSPDPNPVSR